MSKRAGSQSGSSAKRTYGFGKYKGTAKAFPRSTYGKTGMSKYNSGKSRAADFTPASQMRQAAGTETKSMDTHGDGTYLDVTTQNRIGALGFCALGTTSINAAYRCLNATQEGTGVWNRVGRRIRMKSIQIKGHIIPNPACTVNLNLPTFARIMLVYDRQPNFAFPAVQDLVAGRDNNGGIFSTSFVGLNMDQRDRFLVLRDSQLTLLPNETPPAATLSAPNAVADYNLNAGSPQGSYNINWFVKLKGSIAHYSGTSADPSVAQISEGNLFLFLFAENGGGAPPSVTNTQWLFEFVSRLKFLE